MFCPKCGNQVNANERFCGKCGENLQNVFQQQVQPQQVQPQPQYQQPGTVQPPYSYQPYPQAPVQPAANSKEATTLKILYLVLTATSLLSAFLWFAKGMYASAMGMKQTGSFHQMCQGGGEILSVLNVIFGIVLAVLFLLPVLTNTAGKRRRLIGTKILAILQTLCFAIVMLAAVGEASGSYWGVTISWGLTFVGWIYLLTILAALILPYMISSKSKKFM